MWLSSCCVTLRLQRQSVKWQPTTVATLACGKWDCVSLVLFASGSMVVFLNCAHLNYSEVHWLPHPATKRTSISFQIRLQFGQHCFGLIISLYHLESFGHHHLAAVHLFALFFFLVDSTFWAVVHVAASSVLSTRYILSLNLHPLCGVICLLGWYICAFRWHLYDRVFTCFFCYDFHRLFVHYYILPTAGALSSSVIFAVCFLKDLLFCLYALCSHLKVGYFFFTIFNWIWATHSIQLFLFWLNWLQF